MFSSSNPPPLPHSAPMHPSEPPIWTLDELFILPKGRIKYYRKLYSRLLKSTSPGKSDHRMLMGALDKLDKLLVTLESRADVRVSGSTPKKEAPPPIETEDEVVIDLRARQSTLEPQPRAPPSNPTSPSQRASDSTRASGSLSSRSGLLVYLDVCDATTYAYLTPLAAGDRRTRHPRQIAERQHPPCLCQLLTWNGGFLPIVHWTYSLCSRRFARAH